MYFSGSRTKAVARSSAQKNRERPVGRSRFCCWLQTAKIPSLFARLDAEHQQFINVLLRLLDFLSQLGDLPIQCRLAEGPLLV